MEYYYVIWFNFISIVDNDLILFLYIANNIANILVTDFSNITYHKKKLLSKLMLKNKVIFF